MPDASVQPEASTVSVGKSLRYIGNWAYAYSGSYEANNANQTVLDFTTGSGYIYGQIELFGGTNFDSPGDGAQTTGQVTFNGEVITVLKNVTKYPSDGGQGGGKCKVVIPPTTRVVVKIDSNEDNANELCHVVLTGRVYGAE